MSREPELLGLVEGREHEPIPGPTPPGVGKLVVDATHGGEPVEGMPAATIYYRLDQRDATSAPTSLPKTIP